MKKNIIDLNQVTLGCDPEILLFSELENKHIPAIGLIGGTKNKPLPITQDGHFIQLDGVATEFNIPPCSTKEDYVKHINFVKNYINDTIAKPNNLVLSKSSSALFTDEQLNCKEAQEIGCTASIDPYGLIMSSPGAYQDNWRFVGGHVHCGYNDHCEETSLLLSKVLDLFLGVPSVLIDKDNTRRNLYGKAGEMRFTKFGMEYRSLSNFWIFQDKLIEWVFSNTLKAMEFINIGGIITNELDIQKCINTYDKQLALEIIEDYQIELPEAIHYLDTIVDTNEVVAS